LPSSGQSFPEPGQKNLDDVPEEKKSEFFSIVLAANELQL
jgi:hypothetical protein